MSVAMEIYVLLWLAHVGLWVCFFAGGSAELGRNYAEFMQPWTSVHQSLTAWVARGCAYGFVLLIWFDTFML